MSISWWRSWHGAPTDLKWSVIAARSGSRPGVVSAVAWALFDYASQNSDRGSIAGFDAETYAVYSGFPQEEVEAIMQAMTDKGIIQDGRLKNWEKRQPKREDDSADRVRKFRAMKRNVTHGNAVNNKETPQIKEEEEDKESEEEGEFPPPPIATAAISPDPYTNIYTQVTGQIVIPSTEREKAEPVLEAIYLDQGRSVEKAVAHCRPYFQEWCSRKRSNGQPYSRLNTAWLDWAAAGEIPPQSMSGQEPSGAQYLESMGITYGGS